jgi:CBS-domain-containing membrane protein
LNPRYVEFGAAVAITYKTPAYVYKTNIRPFIDYGVPILDEEASLSDALAALGRSANRTVLLRKADTRQLAGIITNCDLAKMEKLGTDLGAKKAKDIATTSPGVLGVRDDAMLWELLQLINGQNSYKRPFNQVPVLDEMKQIVGLISKDDLNRRMLEIESSGITPNA